MALAAEEVKRKKQEYETFLNTRLRGDLSKATELRDKYQSEYREVEDLEGKVKKLQQEKPSSLEERVELGHGVSMQATVPDPSHIFVSIGLGFYAELTWEEALQVTALKKAAIQQKLDASKATVAKIQLHAKLVAEGLEGLSRLTAE